MTLAKKRLATCRSYSHQPERDPRRNLQCQNAAKHQIVQPAGRIGRDLPMPELRSADQRCGRQSNTGRIAKPMDTIRPPDVAHAVDSETRLAATSSSAPGR